MSNLFVSCFCKAAAFIATALMGMQVVHAQAPLYVCKNNGVVEYNNSPASAKDKNCEVKPMPQITTIPAPVVPKAAASNAGAGSKSAPQATATPTPGNFPKIDSGTQKARDNDRAAILDEERRREQSKLQTLKSEFNNGEPERRGDERNYQKYLDRVEKLKEDIQRSETNLKSLDREMAGVKG